MHTHCFLMVALLLSFSQVSCVSKVKEMARDVKYSAYETIGIEKRDLFKKQIGNVKEEQGDSKEAFQDALEQLKSVYKVDGEKLEREYNKLKDRYEEANSKANDVKISVIQLETVAEDLFKEWSKEIQEMTAADLKVKSQDKLNLTRSKYRSYFSQLKKSEQKMDPVLKKLKDQVLYLKHNLNASMLAGLKVEADRIGSDIDKLMSEMNKTSAEADELIGTL